MALFKVRCPNCGALRKTIIRDGNPVNKIRECFHCHKRFVIYQLGGKSQIVPLNTKK